MTRPYTTSERNDARLFVPATTDAFGDFIFAVSSGARLDQSQAVAKDISIGAAWPACACACARACACACLLV
jgi:hypothetical protein